MNKIFFYTIKLFFILTILIFFLEILLRISDQNCYSILPIYFDNGHSTLIKDESFCIKYTGHPKSTYKTDNLGIRVNNKKNQNNDFENLLIGDSQAMGYGINFEDHFLYRYLSKKNLGSLGILGTPHNDLNSIISFSKFNDFKFNEYKKIYFLISLAVDIDRFVFGWQRNWNISNSYFEINLSKYLRLYPYLKNIYLKIKKYHFTYRPSINPYLDYISVEETKFLISEIINQYELFLNQYEINNYEFIILAPAWYLDNDQIEKYKIYYSEKQFKDLKNNLSFYISQMQKSIEFLRYNLMEKSFRFKIIDILESNSKDFFQINNYHLNSIGHEEIFKIL